MAIIVAPLGKGTLPVSFVFLFILPCSRKEFPEGDTLCVLATGIPLVGAQALLYFLVVLGYR